MVIYAEITLESIISLLFTVAVHNLSHDTDVAVQTGDTMPCFNSSFSPSCVSGSSTVNDILWGYLSQLATYFKVPRLYVFFLYKPKQRVFLLQRCGYLVYPVMSLWGFSHKKTGLCFSTCGSTSNMVLNRGFRLASKSGSAWQCLRLSVKPTFSHRSCCWLFETLTGWDLGHPKLVTYPHVPVCLVFYRHALSNFVLSQVQSCGSLTSISQTIYTTMFW